MNEAVRQLLFLGTNVMHLYQQLFAISVQFLHMDPLPAGALERLIGDLHNADFRNCY